MCAINGLCLAWDGRREDGGVGWSVCAVGWGEAEDAHASLSWFMATAARTPLEITSFMHHVKCNL